MTIRVEELDLLHHEAQVRSDWVKNFDYALAKLFHIIGYSRNNDSSDNRYKGKGKRTDDKVYRSFVNKQRERGF